MNAVPATPNSSDLNQIEMAFSKLKSHIRMRAIRTLYSLTECQNYFKDAGYI